VLGIEFVYRPYVTKIKQVRKYTQKNYKGAAIIIGITSAILHILSFLSNQDVKME